MSVLDVSCLTLPSLLLRHLMWLRRGPQVERSHYSYQPETSTKRLTGAETFLASVLKLPADINRSGDHKSVPWKPCEAPKPLASLFTGPAVYDKRTSTDFFEGLSSNLNCCHAETAGYCAMQKPVWTLQPSCLQFCKTRSSANLN